MSKSDQTMEYDDDIIHGFKQSLKLSSHDTDEYYKKFEKSQTNTACDAMVCGLNSIIKNLETQLSRERSYSKDIYLMNYAKTCYVNNTISQLREEIIQLHIQNNTLIMENNKLRYKLSNNPWSMPEMNAGDG